MYVAHEPTSISPCIKSPHYTLPVLNLDNLSPDDGDRTGPSDNNPACKHPIETRARTRSCIATRVAVANSLHPFERPAWKANPWKRPLCHAAASSQDPQEPIPRDMSSNDTHWLGTDSMERDPIASHESCTNWLHAYM